MLAILFTLAALAGILVVSEFLWQKNIARGENGRKFVHIVTGCFIAFWPYYLSTKTISILAVLSLAAVLVVRFTKLITAIHDIKRVTAGEYFYPIGLLYAVHYSYTHWVFTAAMLFIALADGMAAVIGKKWGVHKLPIKLFGMEKSYIGSIGYIFFSYVSIGVAAALGGSVFMQQSLVTVYVLLPLVSVLLEAASPYGLDNLIVPIVGVYLLNGVVK